MIICKTCGSVDDYRTISKSNQNVAFCNSCDAYIKNLPQHPPKFHFGKYKDRVISTIIDYDYLRWASMNITGMSIRMRRAIESQLNHLQNECR